LKPTTLYGRDHLGDTNMEQTTWEIPDDLEHTILEMQVYMEERQRYSQI
jgi:hypothetical protein